MRDSLGGPTSTIHCLLGFTVLITVFACRAATPTQRTPSRPGTVQPPAQGALASGTPLTEADFVVAGIKDLVDTQTVRRLLGPPDSVSNEPDFRDSTTQWITWHYKNGCSVFLAYIGQAE